MIYSFENPEQGAVPVEQLMARAAGSGAGRPSPQAPPSSTPSSPTQSTTSPPQTAEGAVPAAAYR
jgi:hypothetical protein